MKALTYIEHGEFALIDKSKPIILDSRDAIIQVTLGSICTSHLHIKHGAAFWLDEVIKIAVTP